MLAVHLSGALVGVTLGGCRSSGGGVDRPAPPAEVRVRNEGDVIARVGGEPLTEGAFFQHVLEKFGPRTLRYEILTDVLFLHAAQREGIEVSDEDVAEAVDRLVESMAQGRDGVERLEKEYAARGMSMRDVKADLVPGMRTELIKREVVRRMRQLNDEALRVYYERTYKWKRYETRQIAYGFVGSDGRTPDGGKKLQALKRAELAARQIRGGADFATIARMESDDELTRRSGGRLGPVHENWPIPPEFKEVIFALKPGEVSDPVENPIEPAFHVFQVTEILPAESFVDCEETIRKELREKEPAPEEIAAATQVLREQIPVEWMEAGSGS